MSTIKLAGLIVAPILLAIFLLVVGINLTEILTNKKNVDGKKPVHSLETLDK